MKLKTVNTENTYVRIYVDFATDNRQVNFPLKDGTYKTYSTFKERKNTKDRTITIKDGIVYIPGSKFTFSQDDFFAFNKLSEN